MIRPTTTSLVDTLMSLSYTRSSHDALFTSQPLSATQRLATLVHTRLTSLVMITRLPLRKHIRLLKYMQMDATARSAAARMSSSITPSTSAVPAPVTPMVHVTSTAPTRWRPASASWTTLRSMDPISRTSGPTRTRLRPSYANPPTLIRFPLSSTASTKSILHNISATLHYGEDFIVRPFHPMLTMSPDATDYNVLISAVEATHFTLSVTLGDPTVPKTF
jgi:hypothetical protein